jgi:UDP-N-acetylglucosamine 2-epimerase
LESKLETKKLNILVVFGTRPEAIKLFPVIKALKKYAPQITTTTCNTEQQKDLSNPLTHELDLHADITLNIMKPNQSLNTLSSTLLIKLETLLTDNHYTLIIVQGDTTTATCTALAAFHRKIPIAHVEAGLRTHSLQNPFPEEMNRRLIDQLSTYKFSPTNKAKKNLEEEGLGDNTWTTGNTGIDTLLHHSNTISTQDQTNYLNHLNIPTHKKLILVTCHRRETIGLPQTNIAHALTTLSKQSHIQIVFIIHPNPNIGPKFQTHFKNMPIICLPPQPYTKMLTLMKSAYLILTDSGGLQEEAPSLNKPVLVLRETTERMEGIQLGCAKLVGTCPQTIVKETCHLLNSSTAYDAMIHITNPYGNGHAGQFIATQLSTHLNVN